MSELRHYTWPLHSNKCKPFHPVKWGFISFQTKFKQQWPAESHSSLLFCNFKRLESVRLFNVFLKLHFFHTCLIQFGWTALEFFFPLGAVRLGRWECSSRTRVHTRSRPNKRTETSLKSWSQCAFKRTLERFVCGENAIWPQTDPTAKRTAHFWTKSAAVVSCAVHYGMRKCLLTVCSLACQVADKLGLVRLRRCRASKKFGDLRCTFAVCSALIHYFPAASALHVMNLIMWFHVIKCN